MVGAVVVIIYIDACCCYLRQLETESPHCSWLSKDAFAIVLKNESERRRPHLQRMKVLSAGGNEINHATSLDEDNTNKTANLIFRLNVFLQRRIRRRELIKNKIQQIIFVFSIFFNPSEKAFQNECAQMLQ